MSKKTPPLRAHHSSRALLGMLLATVAWLPRPSCGKEAPYTYKPADHGQIWNSDREALVMPRSFLREFDPVTILFPTDMNPAGPGPLDNPDQFLSIRPKHPGEYRWIDPRTIEFRPAVPWSPMQVYTVRVSGVARNLTALLTPPTRVFPSPGSRNLAPFSRIELTFASPVSPDILSRLVTFETTPLPGIEAGNAKVYGASDYTIKVLENSSGSSSTYSFVFKKPFANGQRIRTIVRLADDISLSDARRVYLADTRKEFAIETAGTGEYQFTMTAGGNAYSREQAIRLPRDGSMIIDFSAPPVSLDLSQVRNLVHFSPAPKSMTWSLSGSRLRIRLDVDQERLYKAVLSPADIRDKDDRKLQLSRECSFHFFQPLDRQYARWGLGKGLVERFGPQHFPLQVNGISSLDVRAFRIDPFHKAFWPFPGTPVRIDESSPPPGPGEEPPLEDSIKSPLGTAEIGRHIRMLGSPPYSAVLDLRKEGVARFQNLELKPIFAKISGEGRPGTYLVGFRPLDGSSERSYVRIQVTDLSLSTVESKREVLFSVTSIATGKPVPDAEVSIEGLSRQGFHPLATGRTDKRGMFVLKQTDANYAAFKGSSVKRVSVRSGEDVLVLDARSGEAPPSFANNHWSSRSSTWLEWMASEPYDLAKDRVSEGFVFTERPIYRPNETIYFKTILRTLHQGRILPADTGSFLVQVRSPAGIDYDFPVGLSPNGTFSDSLVQKDLPTGEYFVKVVHRIQGRSPRTIASTSFQVESYRLPTFEVKMDGPDKARNDRPVSVRLNASYYAGGKVSGQNVSWKVVSYPFTWSPSGLKGYLLSTDSRFGAVAEERQEGIRTTSDNTDENGQALLVVNPQTATNGNPRRYVCEATVTDVDNQTVSSRYSFVSLPPFVLALRTDRHLTGTSTIKADIVAMGIGGNLEAGHKVQVRLKKMSWISYLQETDFSRGQPKYRTQESMELLEERTVKTTKAPLAVEFTDKDPGVYVLELDARDKLGRLQTLKVDLFLAGNKPVTWKKGEQLVFETVPDKDLYQPGDRARILLKSPYQRAMALAVIENPSGIPEYRWIEISNGQGEFTLPVTPDMAPRIPVSFLLMRARISDEKRTPDGSTVDAGRPQTMANTTWLRVDQTENRLKVSLAHPRLARPGEQVSMTIGLADEKGQPRSGEVALWLVDEAVLSLAQERSIDALSAFTPGVSSHITFRDIRNTLLGNLRIPENPGGDGFEGEDEGAFGKLTVRKNFKTVPYWNPSIQIDKTGTSTVRIALSDDLTNFAVRAVATSGQDRFGTAASQLRVRLPVLVQPALPRFVRLGDTFKAGGVARIVEGAGGPGKYSVQAEGLEITGPATGGVALDPKKAQSVRSMFTVPDPGFDSQGNLLRDSVGVTMSVVRESDKASDAFSVRIPLRMDRPWVDASSVQEMSAGKAAVFPALAEPARPGTLTRSVMLSNQMGILKAVSAMRSLVQYPYGCSEQRISRTLPSIAYRDLWAQYGIEAPAPDVKRMVSTTIEHLVQSQTSDGLVAYWPGGNGYIHLTAYAVEFLTEVKRANETSKAGYDFDEDLYRKAISALKRGLRSDYSRFVSGEAYHERTAALLALAKAGDLDLGYARELASQTSTLDVQSQAKVFEALQGNRDALGPEIESVNRRLWSETVFKLEDGREVFGGLQERSFRIGSRVHSNEITALAAMVGAFSSAPDKSPKLPLLVDELVSLGDQKDWGSTQANSMALLSLRSYLRSPTATEDATGTLTWGSATNIKLPYRGKTGALSHTWSDASEAKLQVDRTGKTPFFAKYTHRFLPQAPGSQAEAEQKGFVVRRELVILDGKTGNRKVPLEKGGSIQNLSVGDILEEHIQVKNPRDRTFVAVSAPFAAGLEYMNPRLETSGTDAMPSGTTTNPGDYQSFADDEIDYFFEDMPAGTYDFYFRLKATVEGSFSHPSARAEMMYDMATYGSSPGTRIVVSPQP